MSTSTIPNLVYIVTEKQPHDDYFNTFKPTKLIETVSAIALTDFEDRAVFEPGASRSLVRRLKPGEEKIFDLPTRFVKGGHIVFTRIDAVTAVRTLVFDSGVRLRYEQIVEDEVWAIIENIRAEMQAIARG